MSATSRRTGWPSWAGSSTGTTPRTPAPPPPAPAPPRRPARRGGGGGGRGGGAPPPLAPETVIDLAASRSYLITMPADERAAALARVRHLLDTHPPLAGRAAVGLPHVTR